MLSSVPGRAGSPLLGALGTLLAGAGFGVVVVALNHAESAPLRSLAMVSGGGAAWATFGIAMAAWWRRLAPSVAAATFALAAAVAAYYVADAAAAGSPLSQDFGDLGFWIVGALVVGPPLGLVGWRARHDGTWLGLAAMLVVPVGFAAESAIYLDGFAWLSPRERVTRLAIVVAALAVVAMMVARRLRPARRRTRLSPADGAALRRSESPRT